MFRIKRVGIDTLSEHVRLHSRIRRNRPVALAFIPSIGCGSLRRRLPAGRYAR